MKSLPFGRIGDVISGLCAWWRELIAATLDGFEDTPGLPGEKPAECLEIGEVLEG